MTNSLSETEKQNNPMILRLKPRLRSAGRPALFFLAAALFTGCAGRTAPLPEPTAEPEPAVPADTTEIPESVAPVAEAESEDDRQINRYLSELKTEADTLYERSEVYGIDEWDDEEVPNTRLFEFCRELPKGAELHTHEITLLPFDRFIAVIRDHAWIDPEEENGTVHLYTENNRISPNMRC